MITHASWKKKLWPFVFCVIFGLTLVMVFELASLGRVYPGVWVGNVPLGTLTAREAEAAIEKKIGGESQVFLLTREGKRWELRWGELGIKIEKEETVKRALAWGREGAFFEQWQKELEALLKGVEIPMAWNWDSPRVEKKIADLSSEFDKPPEEPEVSLVNGIAVSSGQDGVVLDRENLRETLSKKVASLSEDQEIPLRLVPVKVRLTEAEREDLRQRAEKFLKSRIVLSFPDGGEERNWTLGEKEIVGFLAPYREGTTPKGIREDKIASFTATLSETINRPEENAAFQFVPESGRVNLFRPAREGLRLDEATAIREISRAILLISKGEEKQINISLPVVKSQPTVTTDSVNILGIKELLGRGTSYFFGSIPGRIHNLELATSRVNGALVAPGEIFSFNQTVGDISAATGYQQAYVIKGGRTVLGDGGGVCQVSTTLFRAILNAGLPVEERWAHAYRVHYYEENSPVGLDATVYAPSVDLKFKNDTGAYILIQAKADRKAMKVTFELYGTSDGRKATIGKTRLWDVTPPPPDQYQDDPTLPAGVVKQIDFSAWGSKAAFDWVVTRDGETLQKRTFYSNYQPWRAIYLRGTK